MKHQNVQLRFGLIGGKNFLLILCLVTVVTEGPSMQLNHRGEENLNPFLQKAR